MESKEVNYPSDTKEAMEYCTKNGYNPPLATTRYPYSTMVVQMTKFANEKTTSQQQTIERLREGLKSGIETMDYLLNKLPKDDIISRHEVKSRKSQFEQLLNTTEPIDQ